MLHSRCDSKPIQTLPLRLICAMLRRGRGRTALVLRILMGCCLWLSQVSPAQGATAVAWNFDWSMPDRFGLDANQDGLIDYFTTTESIAPAQWTVNFEIQGATPDLQSFEVAVDGVTRLVTRARQFSLSFPNEDSYDVRITAIGFLGVRTTVTHRVTVQDWLIVGLGDSYASGEGNPDIPIAGHLFDDYNRLSGNLSTFQSQLAAAAQTATARQGDYEAVRAQAARVRSAQQAYDAALAFQRLHCDREACVTDPIFNTRICVPDPDSQCPGAIQNSAAKLADLFFQMTKLGLQQTLSNIEGRLQQLEAAALQSWTAAQTLVNNLQQTINQTQTDLANIQAQAKPVWQNADAHRSAWSGQARAAMRLEQADRKTSVTFVHLAVSGAVITDVIDQLNRLNVGGREIDAIIVSAGGNDARFSGVIQSLIKFKRSDVIGAPQIDTLGGGVAALQRDCDALPILGSCGIPDYFAGINESAGTMLSGALPRLPPRYRSLDERIQNLRGFTSADLVDANEVARKLVKDSTLPIVEIRNQLSASVMNELVNYVRGGFPPANAARVRSLLLSEFQRILSGNVLILDAAALRSPLFAAEDVSAALRSPVGSTLRRLNHLLLSETFPLAIRRPLRPLVESSRIFLTEYPDATHTDTEQLCTPTPVLPGIESAEFAWVANTMIPQLNAAVKAGAVAGGWRYVSGVASRFRVHGVCASETWFNSAVDTFTTQGDIFGIAHPNELGHQAYGEAIFAALSADLYPGGQARLPRPITPVTPLPVLKLGAASFTLPTLLNHRYLLQAKPALLGGVWTTVLDQIGTGEDLILSDPRPLSRTGGFYRVVVQ